MSQELEDEGPPVQLAAPVPGVSESGYYEWRGRAPSVRTLRHTWLTGQITQIHAASPRTYGAWRVHAELTLGQGLIVEHGTVELLMRRAGSRRLRSLRLSANLSAGTLDDVGSRRLYGI